MSWPLLRRTINEGKDRLKSWTTTTNEGDPCVAIVQPVYLARHQGGAVHTLFIASFHGVRTSVV